MVFPQSSSLLSCILFLLSSFQANVFARPEPTPADFNANFRQRSPLPTGRPLSPLEKRQIDDAGHRTCGYAEGYSDIPVTCSGQSKCVTDSVYAAAGCCDPNDPQPCLIATACIGESDLEDCGTACLGDTQRIYCTSGRFTVCARFAYDYLTEIFTEYACLNESASIRVFPTSRGEEIESEDGEPIYTNALAISDGLFVDSSLSGSDDESGGDDDTNIGAIVGGVIGGLAVLAALIGGLTYLFYRNKRQKSNHAPAPATAANPSLANNDKVFNAPGGASMPSGSVSTAGQLSPSYDNKTMSYYPPPSTDPHQSMYSLQPQQPYPQQPYPQQPYSQQPMPQQPIPMYRPMSPQELPQQMINPVPGVQTMSPPQHMSQISPTSTSPAPQYEQPVQLQQPSQPVQSQGVPQDQPQAFQLEGTQVDKPATHEATGAYIDTPVTHDNQRANEVP